MKELIEIATKFWTWFMANPEAQQIAIGIISAFLLKRKIFTEAEIAKAKKLLFDGAKISEVTDKTRLTVADVAKHIQPLPDASMNTNKKKIQRVLRAIFRGWLR